MITNNQNLTPLNPTVTAYRYPVSLALSLAAATTFTPLTYITNQMRNTYGYANTSKIVMLEILVKSITYEAPIASALNVQTFLSIANTGVVRRFGLSTDSMVCPIQRTLTATTVYGYNIEPATAAFSVVTLANYITTNFTLTLNNAVTRAAIISADIVTLNLEFIEHVSVY